MYFHQTHLASLCIQIIHDFFCRFTNGTHCHDYFGGVRRTVIIERLVIRSRFFVHLFHYRSNCFYRIQICLISGFAVLEESFRLLRGTHKVRMIRVLCFLSECRNGIPIQHLSQCIVIPYFNFLLFMTGPEAIKEVEYRQAGLNCRQMRHCRQIHYFLRAVRGQHGKTGLSGCHHVRMVPKNRQRLRGDSSRRYMKNARQPFRRNLIHVRNHEEQTLRCGISRC